MRRPDSQITADTAGTRAFTRIELTVALAVLAFSFLLLGPAINATREAVRRAECNARLRDIAIVLQASEGPSNRDRRYVDPYSFRDEEYASADILLFVGAGFIGLAFVSSALVGTVGIYCVDRAQLRREQRETRAQEERPSLFLLDRWFCSPSSSPD